MQSIDEKEKTAETPDKIAQSDEISETAKAAKCASALPDDETSGLKVRKKKAKRLDAEAAMKNFDGRTVEPPKKRKFGWAGTVLLLVVIGLSVWMMLEIISGSEEEMQSLGEILANASWRFALVSLAVLIGIMICDCLKYAVVLKTTTGKFYVRTSIKVAYLGKFYDNITPFAAGGQPMQIYYLHKKGFSGGVSSAVILIKYFTQMFSWVGVSLVFMAANAAVLDSLGDATQKLLSIAGWIGLGVNMLLPVTVILFALLPKFAKSLCSVIIGFGHKIKIVKDKERTLEKAEKFVNDFRSAFIIMAHKPLAFAALLALCITDVFFTFAFPYFAMKTFSGLGAEGGIATMLSVMALNIYVTQSVAVVPTPGNTGAMEGLGALAFSAFVTGSVQFWSMFGWRFAVYYIYIVIGLGFTVFDFIRKLVRASKKKKAEKQ